jgi:hypothetical protein
MVSFTSGERAAPVTNCRGGCVVPGTGLDDMEIRKFLPLPALELQSFGRPAHNQLLY